MANIKKYNMGDEIHLFYKTEAGEYKTVGCATGHSLSISAATVSVGHKDLGAYDASDIGAISWEVGIEALYTEDFAELHSLMINKTDVDVFWTEVQNYDPEGLEKADGGKWTHVANKGVHGKAKITSLSANANHGEAATYSCTLTGNGALLTATE